MWVTLTLVLVPVVLLGVAVALGASGHRKLDHDLKSLAACFKFD